MSIPRSKSVLLPATVAVLFAAACAEARPRPSAAANWSQLASLAADSIATIGGSFAKGPAALARVTDVAVGPGEPATIIVADAQSAEIRIFDATGAHVKTLGRKGDGPGEFRWISSLAAVQNGIAAWDSNLRRLTIFRDDGSVEVNRMQMAVPPGRQSALIGIFDDGSTVIRIARSEMMMRGAPRGSYTDSLIFLRLDGSSQADTLARIVTAPSWFYDSESSWGFVDQIYGSEVHAAVGTSTLFVGSGDAHSLKAISSSGQGEQRSAVILPPSSRSVTPELVVAERERRLAAVEQRHSAVRAMRRDGSDATGQIVETVREVVASLPAADSAPVFDRLLAEADSVLWLRQRSLNDAPESLWIRLDLRTSAATRLTLPARADLVASRFPYFVVQSVDDLDAPVLVIHRISQDD